MGNYAAVQPNDPAYLRVALSMLGLSEIFGPEDEPQILAMYAACGHPEIQHDETAWCAAFVGWCLDEAGLPNTLSLLAISYAKYGIGLDRAKPIPRGAIAVWHRTGGNHVNFVLHDDGSYVTCIGGNQSNGQGGGVTISRRLKDEAIAYRMPKGVVVPLPRPKPRPAETEDADPQIPEPQPQPDDPGVDETPTPPAKPGLLRKVGNWIGGLFTSGGIFYMDWRLGALLVVALILLVGFLLWLFGREPIALWIKKHFGGAC